MGQPRAARHVRRPLPLALTLPLPLPLPLTLGAATGLITLEATEGGTRVERPLERPPPPQAPGLRATGDVYELNPKPKPPPNPNPKPNPNAKPNPNPNLPLPR